MLKTNCRGKKKKETKTKRRRQSFLGMTGARPGKKNTGGAIEHNQPASKTKTKKTSVTIKKYIGRTGPVPDTVCGKLGEARPPRHRNTVRRWGEYGNANPEGQAPARASDANRDAVKKKNKGTREVGNLQTGGGPAKLPQTNKESSKKCASTSSQGGHVQQAQNSWKDAPSSAVWSRVTKWSETTRSRSGKTRRP